MKNLLLSFSSLLALVSAIAAMVAWMIWSGAQDLKSEVALHENDWAVIKQMVPLESDMLECGRCLRRCADVIENHAHTKPKEERKP